MTRALKKLKRVTAILLISVLPAGCAKPAEDVSLKGEGIAAEVYSIASYPSPSETNLRPLFSMADAPPDTPVTEYPYHLEAPSDADPDLIKNVIVAEGEIPSALARRLSAHNKEKNDQYRSNPHQREREYSMQSGKLEQLQGFEMRSMNSRVVSFLATYRIVYGNTVWDNPMGTNIDPGTGRDISLNNVVNDLRTLSRLLLPKLQESYIDARPAGDHVRAQLEQYLSEEFIREKLEMTLMYYYAEQLAWTIDADGIEFVFPISFFEINDLEAPVICARVDFTEAPELFNPRYSGLQITDPPPAMVKSKAQIATAAFEAAEIMFAMKAEIVGGIVWDIAPEGALEAGLPLVVIDAEADHVVAVMAMHDDTTVTVYSGKKKSGTGQHDYWAVDETLQEIFLNAGEVVLLQMEVPYTGATRCVKLLATADSYEPVVTGNMAADGGVYWQAEEPSASDYYPGTNYIELELWWEFFSE